MKVFNCPFDMAYPGCSWQYAFISDAAFEDRETDTEFLMHFDSHMDEIHPKTPKPALSSEVRVTSSTGGEKGTKAQRFDLLPPRPLAKVAELYGFGANKYDDHNWAKGYDWSLSFAAMQRHAWAFWNGEDDDPESGLPHMASVAFHALALIQFMEDHREFDNRPVRP